MNVIDHSAKKDCRTYANCDKAARILSCEEKMMRTLCSWEYLPWLASAILADAWLLSRCDSDLMYILSFVLIILICIFYSVMIFCPGFWSVKINMTCLRKRAFSGTAAVLLFWSTVIKN